MIENPDCPLSRFDLEVMVRTAIQIADCDGCKLECVVPAYLSAYWHQHKLDPEAFKSKRRTFEKRNWKGDVV